MIKRVPTAKDRSQHISTAAWNRLVRTVNMLVNLKVKSRRLRLVNGAGGMTLVDTDDAGEVRAITQEAAQADQYLSVRLLDNDGNGHGTPFDVTAEFQDGATKINECLPDIQSGTYVWIQKYKGTWYLKRPTLTKFTECT